MCKTAVHVIGRLRHGPNAAGREMSSGSIDEWWVRQKWRILRIGVRSQTWAYGGSWSVECHPTGLNGVSAPRADVELVDVRPPAARRQRILAEESDEDSGDEEDSGAQRAARDLGTDREH